MKNTSFIQLTAKNKFILGVIIILSIFRLGLFTKTPYCAIGNSLDDDMHMIKLADSLTQSNWLGDYNHRTLIKSISFPLFLVIAKGLCMPYSMLLGLFYILSAGLITYSISKLTNNKLALTIIYLFFLYSPVGFSYDITQRYYRNAILFPSVLLVLSCIFLVYWNKNSNISSQIKWLIILGVSFSFFYYIREDSIWLFPFLISALLIIAIWQIFFTNNNKKVKILKCIILLIPLIIFILLTIIYCTLNYFYYGVFLTNDRTEGPFAVLTGNMIKIKDIDNCSNDIWLCQNKLQRIIEACPTLKKHKDIILYNYNPNMHVTQNIAGDFSIWNLRYTFSELNYFSNARVMSSYFEQINSELLIAVEKGELEFDNKINFSTQSRGIYIRQFPYYIAKTFKILFNVITYKGAYLSVFKFGTTEQIRYMETFTGTLAIHPTTEKLNFAGWIVEKNNEPVYLQLEDIHGNILISNISLHSSPDIAKAYPMYSTSQNCRFSFELYDFEQKYNINDLRLCIYNNTELIDKACLETNFTERYMLTFDVCEENIYEDSTNYHNYYLINIGNQINHIMRNISFLLIILSIFSFLGIIILFLKNRSWDTFEAFIIVLGLFLDMFLLEFGITIFADSWLYESIWLYSPSIVALSQCLQVLSCCYFYKTS